MRKKITSSGGRPARVSGGSSFDAAAHIRVGIGGWSFEPWRKTFYPPGTPQSRELDYASRHVTSIEVNSTFYRLQKPEVFAKWRDSTPSEFMFSVKAPRFIVNRRDLASAEAAIKHFIDSGIANLGSKLGPILWQLSPTKRFDADELDAFLTMLPAVVGQLPLRHALEIRHATFMTPEFLDILRKHGVAGVYADDPSYPCFADLSSTFVYARLRSSSSSIVTGYSRDALQQWTRRARTWAGGTEPTDLPRIEPRKLKRHAAPRDVFVYFINGAKERNPAAARRLISMLGISPARTAK